MKIFEHLKCSAFKTLYIVVNCPNSQCNKKIALVLTANMVKYGFVCPYCKFITNSQDMFSLVIKNSKTGISN